MSVTTAEVTTDSSIRLAGKFRPLHYRIAIDLPFQDKDGVETTPTTCGMLPVSAQTPHRQFFGSCEIFVETVPSAGDADTNESPAAQDLCLNILNMCVLDVSVCAVLGSPVHQDNTASDSYTMHNPYDVDGVSVMSEGWFTKSLPLGFTEMGPNVLSTWELDEEKERIGISITEPNNYPRYFSVKIAYIGMIGPDTCKFSGLFMGDAPNDPNMFVTQLEPTLARSVFPCFDEPVYKTVMQLALAHKKGQTAVSSGRLIDCIDVGVDEDTALTTCVFAQTPMLSPYLIAFAVGSFNVLETTTSLSPPSPPEGYDGPPPNRTGPLTIRLMFPTDKPASSGMFALDLFKKAIDFFEDLFGYYLPVSKLDMVGVRNMRFLGMENWGLITILLPYLLVDEVTPIERRQRIARLIGHEVAHQWFGNLISISWWRFVWLKEGLARYLEFCFASHCFPKWDMWVEFHSEVLDAALTMDADATTTHPIVCAAGCDNPRTIFDKFDTISYGKGAAVLRMVASLIGEDCLQAALRDLVHKHAFSNFDGKDFASCLNRHYREAKGDDAACDITELLSYWVEHPSHPLVLTVQNELLHVTQVQAPNRALGVIPFLIMNDDQLKSSGIVGAASLSLTNSPTHHARMGDSPSGLNLAPSPTPTLQTFSDPAFPAIVDPTAILSKTAFPTPLHLLAVQQENASVNEVSCTMMNYETVTVDMPWGVELPTLVNPGAAGVILVDYDTHTWLRLFLCAHRLASEDIFSITTTLYAHRFLHVGRLTSLDYIDRSCIMLAWLKQFCTGADRDTATETADVSINQRGGAALHLTSTPTSTRVPMRFHGTTWRRIAGVLAEYQSLLASQGCIDELNGFITFLIAPLVKDGRVGFFPKGTATDYDASDAMSVETCNSLLHVLANAKSPLLQNEAPIVFEWFMRSMYEVDAEALPPTPECAMLMSSVGPCVITVSSHAVAVSSSVAYLCGCGHIEVWHEVMYLLLNLLKQFGTVSWRECCATREPGVYNETALQLLPDVATGGFAAQFTVKSMSLSDCRLLCHHLTSSVAAFDAMAGLAPLATFVVTSPVLTVGIIDAVMRNPALLFEMLTFNRLHYGLLSAFVSVASEKSGDGKVRDALEAAIHRKESLPPPDFCGSFAPACDYNNSVNRLASESLSDDSRTAIQKLKCNAWWASYVSPHFQHYLRNMWPDVTAHHPASGRKDSTNILNSSGGTYSGISPVDPRLYDTVNNVATLPNVGIGSPISTTMTPTERAPNEYYGEISI